MASNLDEKDALFPFEEATEVSIGTSVETNLVEEAEIRLDMRPAYILNQRNNTTLLRWIYDGGNWQSMNCPVGQTCTLDDMQACQAGGHYIQIGTVPCGVVMQVHAIFREADGREVQRNVTNSFVDCASGHGLVFTLRK